MPLSEKKRQHAHRMRRSRTGIEGLDDLTRGGLPTARATLVTGGPGSGKTVLALQTLVNGIEQFGEPGIFVSFEESPDRIASNAEGFGWDLKKLAGKGFLLFDARPKSEMIHAGEFDLLGLLAVLGSRISAMKARRVAFDGLDVLLTLLAESRARQWEARRLYEWLQQHAVTAILTAKSTGSASVDLAEHAEHLQFMVDCALTLKHDVVQGVSQRALRVLKYRGSSFFENEAPLVIGRRGLQVATPPRRCLDEIKAPDERVSSGVARLDAMLGGGYFKGASILITGAPGTAKTTLAGAFAEASCRRKLPTLFFSFDSSSAEIVRNLASVGLQLGRFRRSGLLRLEAATATEGSSETHFLEIREAAREHRAKCLIIDPLSALAKQGNECTAYGVVERLTTWAKREGITVLSTSLLNGNSPDAAGTPLRVSTIADTWIHLSYNVRAGERNRGLTIIKSRGTEHSNQVRELILRNGGIHLAEVYSAGGEVLMGTLRWEKEEAERELERRRALEASAQLEGLKWEEARLEAQLQASSKEMAVLKSRRRILEAEEVQRRAKRAENRARVRQIRFADPGDERRNGRRPGK